MQTCSTGDDSDNGTRHNKDQTTGLHVRVSTVLPSALQFLPYLLGSGLLHTRVRVSTPGKYPCCAPPGHCTLHADQGDHADSPPFTTTVQVVGQGVFCVGEPLQGRPPHCGGTHVRVAVMTPPVPQDREHGPGAVKLVQVPLMGAGGTWHRPPVYPEEASQLQPPR